MDAWPLSLTPRTAWQCLRKGRTQYPGKNSLHNKIYSVSTVFMKKDPVITAIRARRDTTHKLKILSALWHESIMSIVDRLVTREYNAVQGGGLPTIPSPRLPDTTRVEEMP
jgi:hypothetical protein